MAERVKSTSFFSGRSDPSSSRGCISWVGFFVGACRGWALPVLKEDVLWWDVWLPQAPPAWLPALQGAGFGASRLEHDGQGGQQQHEEAQDEEDCWGRQEGGQEVRNTKKPFSTIPLISLLLLLGEAGAGG